MSKELEDLRYELSIVLEAMLLYAGVKKDKLEKDIDNIDSVLENSQSEGVEEVLEVVEYLRKHHGECFE
ncbi:hypothetical protein V5Y92_000412 [Campylobacter upsaliensis]